jgi:hypothetical protein
MLIFDLISNFMSYPWETNALYNWPIFKKRRSIIQLGRLTDETNTVVLFLIVCVCGHMRMIDFSICAKIYAKYWAYVCNRAEVILYDLEKYGHQELHASVITANDVCVS